VTATALSQRQMDLALFEPLAAVNERFAEALAHGVGG
jgi:hypothetical protein